MEIRSPIVLYKRFLSVAALGLVLAGCQDLATDLPDSLPVSFAITVAGGPTDAFDRADRLAVRLLNGNITVLDTVLAFSSDGDDVRMRVRVPRELDGLLVTVSVELRRGNDVLFLGTARDVELSQSTTQVEITLGPVVSRIEQPATQPSINQIGGTTRVLVAAVFATGDTIPDIPITWTALDRALVSVTSDGTVRGLAEGNGRVEARSGTVATVITVRVRGTVTSVTVEPATATIQAGATQTFRTVARDVNGVVLARTPAWLSSNVTVATIDSAGTARGLVPGSTQVRATIDGVVGNAQLTVVPPTPAAPSNLLARGQGRIVDLTWTDNANNETSIEVWRGASGGSLVRVASLPANSNTYREVAGIDEVLDYTVRACNSFGCGESPIATARTVPLPPSNLLLFVTDSLNGKFTLVWSDNSKAETFFQIQYSEDYGLPFSPYDEVTENTAFYSTSLGSYEFMLFRVVACNTAGCSPPTNEVEVYFFVYKPGLPVNPVRKTVPIRKVGTQ